MSNSFDDEPKSGGLIDENFFLGIIIIVIFILGYSIIFNYYYSQKNLINSQLEQMKLDNIQAEEALNRVGVGLDRIINAFDKCEAKYGCECVITDDGMIPTCGEDKNGNK